VPDLNSTQLNSTQLKRMMMTRIVATSEALDSLDVGQARSYRIAPDEIFIEADISSEAVSDAHAIVTKDASMSGVWLPSEDAIHFLEHECPWVFPTERPAFAQGAVAHLPVKLYFEDNQVLFMTSAPFAEDLQDRLEGFLS